MIDEWEKEWDRMAHTVTEYRQEIHELRGRIWYYLKRIDELEAEVRELRRMDSRWVQEP